MRLGSPWRPSFPLSLSAICSYLLVVDRGQPLHPLNLHNHQIFDYKVQPKPAIDPDTFILYRLPQFRLQAEPGSVQLEDSDTANKQLPADLVQGPGAP